MDVDDEADNNAKLLPPIVPPKKPGRKKVYKRKQANRPKERGKYGKPKSIERNSVIGDGDSDLAECHFSDVEVGVVKWNH